MIFIVLCTTFSILCVAFFVLRLFVNRYKRQLCETILLQHHDEISRHNDQKSKWRQLHDQLCSDVSLLKSCDSTRFVGKGCPSLRSVVESFDSIQLPKSHDIWYKHEIQFKIDQLLSIDHDVKLLMEYVLK